MFSGLGFPRNIKRRTIRPMSTAGIRLWSQYEVLIFLLKFIISDIDLLLAAVHLYYYLFLLINDKKWIKNPIRILLIIIIISFHFIELYSLHQYNKTNRNTWIHYTCIRVHGWTLIGVPEVVKIKHFDSFVCVW